MKKTKKKIPEVKRRVILGTDADMLWKVAWTYIQTVIDTAREPFLILDEDLRVLSANKTFYKFFRVKKKRHRGYARLQAGRPAVGYPRTPQAPRKDPSEKHSFQ